jgi:hypothetical protein
LFQKKFCKGPFGLLGRWQNIDRNEIKCNICKSDIGDEMHYILTGFAINDIRQYIPYEV